MATRDLTEIFKNFENTWVALNDEDVVIASGNSLEEVLTSAHQKGFPDPITAFIPAPVKFVI